MDQFKYITTVLWIAISGYAAAQQEMSQEKITEIGNKVQEVIGEHWYVYEADNGFDIYYCRSLQQQYQAWADKNPELVFEGQPLAESLQAFFKPEMADSVSYYAILSLSAKSFDDPQQDVKDRIRFRKNGVLKFGIRFEAAWSPEKIEKIQQKNNLLKEAILAEPIYKTSLDIFADYRYWLPEERWRDRTQPYDFYFQRLPYTSAWYPYAVFITPDKPYFFCDVLYADPSNPQYYKDAQNFIEQERCKTLQVVAFCLGISDFRLLN